MNNNVSKYFGFTRETIRIRKYFSAARAEYSQKLLLGTEPDINLFIIALTLQASLYVAINLLEINQQEDFNVSDFVIENLRSLFEWPRVKQVNKVSLQSFENIEEH